MVESVAEEKPFRISLEGLEVLGTAVAFIVVQYVLDYLADRKAVAAVLCPIDVAAVFCRFREVIYILLLLKGEFLPSRHPVPHYLEVCEFVDEVFEITLYGGLVRACCCSCGYSCDCDHCSDEFHIV